MRAERLLRLVHLLQSRGRATAAELARELEVSTRTIKRDMEALSGAGIPVYSIRGVEGGWALLRDYRTSINALTTGEALAILVGRPTGVLEDLGLDDRGEDAQRKVLAGLSPGAKAQAIHAQERVLVDHHTSRDEFLPELQRAVWADELIRISYGRSKAPFLVAPLGLVVRGADWYLVAKRDDLYRTYRVSRVTEVIRTGRAFERPAGFDLAEHWRSSWAGFEAGLPSFAVTLLLRGEALKRIRWTYARRKHIGTPDAGGWATVELDTQDRDYALQVIRVLGNDAVVVDPSDLRRDALEDARAFVRANRR